MSDPLTESQREALESETLLEAADTWRRRFAWILGVVGVLGVVAGWAGLGWLAQRVPNKLSTVHATMFATWLASCAGLIGGATRLARPLGFVLRLAQAKAKDREPASRRVPVEWLQHLYNSPSGESP